MKNASAMLSMGAFVPARRDATCVSIPCGAWFLRTTERARRVTYPIVLLAPPARIPRVDEKFLAQADQALTGWSDPVGRLRAALEKDEFALYCQPIRALSGPPGFP